VESHRRLAYAQDNGHLSEIEPMYGPDGTVYAADDGLRRDSSVEKLGKLKPVFDSHLRQRHRRQQLAGDRRRGDAGARLRRRGRRARLLKPLGRIVDTHWGALDPAEMGWGRCTRSRRC
jgi:acetyl-CoA C-acetyltransferase